MGCDEGRVGEAAVDDGKTLRQFIGDALVEQCSGLTRCRSPSGNVDSAIKDVVSFTHDG